MREEVERIREVIVIGAGLAGLSAGIYLGRARRDVLLIDAHRSMARWEPDVQNYLGFPEGISGKELLERGHRQTLRYDADWVEDEIEKINGEKGSFRVQGHKDSYSAKRVLLATGIFHIPPNIPCVRDCMGISMFFCKDCDGYRVQGKRIAVVGNTNEAAEYALGLLMYSSLVVLATNGERARWDEQHESWLCEYGISVLRQKITEVHHREGNLVGLEVEGKKSFAIDALFTTRGDLFNKSLAQELGAKVDSQGAICVDEQLQTSVPGLYAAGCVTAANCQMIVAAGQGAIAAQSINRDLFEESLKNHNLSIADFPTEQHAKQS
jgi:thioredoxin reductase (NADPH)